LSLIITTVFVAVAFYLIEKYLKSDFIESYERQEQINALLEIFNKCLPSSITILAQKKDDPAQLSIEFCNESCKRMFAD
jgi:hypothetical protein